MTSNLNKREAAIRAAMSNASLPEQRRLAAELDRISKSRLAASERDASIDLAAETVRDSLSPVLVHGMHTAATDWVTEIAPGYTKAELKKIQRDAQVEASTWFRSTSSIVRSYQDEFTAQARGFAKRTASQYGEAAPVIERTILSRIASLYRTAEGTDAAGIESAAEGDGPGSHPEAADWADEDVLDSGDAAPTRTPEGGVPAAPYDHEYEDAAPESFTEGGTEFSSVESPITARRRTASEDQAYRYTCPNPNCPEHGTAFVPEDFYEDADLSEQDCPDCETPLVKTGSRRRTAARDYYAEGFSDGLYGNPKRDAAEIFYDAYGTGDSAGAATDQAIQDYFDGYDEGVSEQPDSDDYETWQDTEGDFDGPFLEASVNSSIWSRAARQYLAAEEGTTPAQSPGEADEEQDGEAVSTLPREVSVTGRPESFPNFVAPAPAADTSSSRARNISANARRRKARRTARIEPGTIVTLDGQRAVISHGADPGFVMVHALPDGRSEEWAESTAERIIAENGGRFFTSKRKTAEIIYESPSVTVFMDGQGGGFSGPTYKVKPADGRAKTFKGESAWSDAERYASDFDFGAWGCTGRINGTPRGSLTTNSKRKTASTGFSCKECGAESPVGVGYKDDGPYNPVDPNCPNYHVVDGEVVSNDGSKVPSHMTARRRSSRKVSVAQRRARVAQLRKWASEDSGDTNPAETDEPDPQAEDNNSPEDNFTSESRRRRPLVGNSNNRVAGFDDEGADCAGCGEYTLEDELDDDGYGIHCGCSERLNPEWMAENFREGSRKTAMFCDTAYTIDGVTFFCEDCAQRDFFSQGYEGMGEVSVADLADRYYPDDVKCSRCKELMCESYDDDDEYYEASRRRATRKTADANGTPGWTMHNPGDNTQWDYVDPNGSGWTAWLESDYGSPERYGVTVIPPSGKWSEGVGADGLSMDEAKAAAEQHISKQAGRNASRRRATRKTAVSFDPQEMMEDILYNIPDYGWFYSVKWDDSASSPVAVVAEDPNGDGDGTITKSVSAADIQRAINQLIQQGYRHCGGISISNPEDWDGCVSDDVLQQAVYGEIVFG